MPVVRRRVVREIMGHPGAAGPLFARYQIQLHLFGQHGAHPVPILRIEQRHVPEQGRGGIARKRGGIGPFAGLAQAGAAAMQRRLYRGNGGFQDGGDLLQRMPEHVLKDHRAALGGGHHVRPGHEHPLQGLAELVGDQPGHLGFETLPPPRCRGQPEQRESVGVETGEPEGLAAHGVSSQYIVRSHSLTWPQ